MRVIVTGGTGAIGGPLLRRLREGGHDVTVVIRNPRHRDLITRAGAQPVVADVLDRDELLRAVSGLTADAIMHQATALRSARRRLRPDDPTGRLRTEGTAHLIDVAHAVGARRFVTQSLITGYGHRDHGRRLLTEADRFGVTVGSVADLVATTTQAAEQQVFAAPGVDGIALRYGMFYGPKAFSDLFAELMRKHVPVVPRNGGGHTGFIHIEDAAAAAVTALEAGRPDTAYNIVDDTPVTWGEFCAAVARAHRTPKPIALPGWLIRLAMPYLGCLMIDTDLRVSNALAAEELGWRPQYSSIMEGLTA